MSFCGLVGCIVHDTVMAILLMLLVWAIWPSLFPGPAHVHAAFTEKDNVLRGYDCSKPRGVEDKTLDDTSILCDGHYRHTKLQANRTYQLLVMEEVQRFTGYKCVVLDTRNARQCGNWDHETAWGQYNYDDLPLAPSIQACQQMVNDKTYIDMKGTKHAINNNGVSAIFFQEVGRTWVTGTNPDETSEVQCSGEEWRFNDMSVSDMVVDHHIKIVVIKETFRYSEGQLTALSDGTKLRCIAAHRGCRTAEATYFWDYPEDRCQLGVSKHVEGVEATDEGGQTVFMSTDGSLVRLVFTQTESHCGRIVQATNYKSLYLAKLPHHRPFNRLIEPTAVSLSTYINNRDDFLYNHLADQIDKELGSVLRNNCLAKMKEPQVLSSAR